MKKRINYISLILIAGILSSCSSNVVEESQLSSSETTNVSESVEDSIETDIATSENDVVETTVAPVIEKIEVVQNNKKITINDGSYVELEGVSIPTWWNEYTRTIGDLSSEELESWSIFFAENDFEHRLMVNEFDEPSKVDLRTLFYGASDEEWTQEKIDSSEMDVKLISLDEVNDSLVKMFGMTNDEFDNPLTLQTINGKECVVCCYSGASDTKYSNFWGGTLSDDLYTLMIPGRIIQFEKVEDGIKMLKCLNTDTSSFEGCTFYNPNELFSEGNIKKLNEKTQTDLELQIKEYYARHGVVFDDPVLDLYFNSMSWYDGNIKESEFDVSEFNDIEQANIETLKSLIHN